MRVSKPLVASALLMLMAAHCVAATCDDFLHGSNDDGSHLPFRYIVPFGYDGAQAYPLILFLHGSGERGSDDEAQLDNNANGAMQLLASMRSA
jgi:predicted peptidase